jgi:hypothetical protein
MEPHMIVAICLALCFISFMCAQLLRESAALKVPGQGTVSSIDDHSLASPVVLGMAVRDAVVQGHVANVHNPLSRAPDFEDPVNVSSDDVDRWDSLAGTDDVDRIAEEWGGALSGLWNGLTGLFERHDPEDDSSDDDDSSNDFIDDSDFERFN